MSMRVGNACLLVAASVILLAGGCREKEELLLDDHQRMAYATRPAVVRVKAYATANFVPSAPVMRRINQDLVRRGLADADRAANGTPGVETGAGGSGSGFIVHREGFILTSGHVVGLIRDPSAVQQELRRNGAIAALMARYPLDTLRTLHRNGALIEHIESLTRTGSLRDIRTFREVELSNGQSAPFAILEFSPSLAERGDDVALIRIERSSLPTVRLGDSRTVHVQDPIWVIGYPSVASSSDETVGGWLSQDSDIETTVSGGSITAIKQNVANVPVFQTDVPFYPGNSGGPAVNRRGEVIGLATWGHATADSIKFLVPVHVARPWLEKRELIREAESTFTLAFRRALEATAAGRWRTARAELRRAEASFPGNPDVARVSADVDAAIRRSSGGQSLLLILIGAGVLALLIGLTLRGRREREQTLLPDSIFHARSSGASGGPFTGTERPEGLIGTLTVLNGNRAGQRLGLGGSGIKIGRESALCEIVFEDPKVSRLHAEILQIDGRVLLIDKSSSNGTWVNHERIDRRLLSHGDIIYFGGRNAVAVAFHE
ncbi:MAG TPA: trypsin-like peptidase domain-containing protein [Thermoanaerobaculia bacterium]|nr:trypsin-like peptidase domain-containing protein [Thermoanaerobaculia bacterium]